MELTFACIVYVLVSTVLRNLVCLFNSVIECDIIDTVIDVPVLCYLHYGNCPKDLVSRSIDCVL